MALSTNQLIATAEITINGKIISQFNYLNISQIFGGHHEFEVNFPINSFSSTGKSDGMVEMQNLIDTNIGKDISIKLMQGEMENRQLKNQVQKNIFKGIITSVKLNKNIGGLGSISFSGVSPTILLNANVTSRTFTLLTLSDIVTKVLDPFKTISKNISPAYKEKIEYITQYEEDNFHFLQRLAETYGEWMYYDGQTIIFGKSGREAAAPVELTYEVNIIDLDYNVRVIPLNFEASYYDYEKEELFKVPSLSESVDELQSYGSMLKGKAEKLYNDELINLSFQGYKDKNSLKKAVKLKKGERVNQLATLSGKTPEMEIRLGGLIKVKDDTYQTIDSTVGRTKTSTTDYGTFVVTRISHSLDSRGVYKNYIDAIPQDTSCSPVDYHIIAPQAKPQPALVVDTNDPKELGRIKVSFYWQGTENTPWIRVSNMMAAGSKSYFIPEIADVVFVDFEFGNPDLPFVTGAMYCGKEEGFKPGSLFNKDNNIKGIITRSGNHIIINDESGKESISIYNKDKKNSIELSLDGTHITIKSTGDINLQATGDITMKAKNIMMTAEKDAKTKAQHAVMETTGGDVELIAGKELMLSAMTNATLSATAELKASGAMVKVSADASLDLESSGVASLKGTLVKIN
ncbi:type VI secretion system Vgr family protein [uncultured Fibrella sp.]|uniref:type VI secretion system Vgr family protein n=1 Tax=uncultured Fibrella sp. TaxID=1284596 RepID=UPI0035CA844A